ncbi:MAG: SLC13/DASS family transporter [bacterium]|nr:SLC13/DASS family transporter [bacterium]MCP4801016.1 SLC13/DASS family transporter [bacterium]
MNPGRILGPLLAVAVWFLGPGDESVTAMASIAIWMAVWWMTEAAPLAITALLPVVLYPLLGVMPTKLIAPVYFNSIIFLFLGGFIVALAMEKWNLHRRIALGILLTVGSSPKQILLGFMLASAFLSMWISNTATTMMMIPIVLAVIRRVSKEADPQIARRFTVGLLLAVAYGASCGGIATLIGTPPNPLFVSNLSLLFPNAPEVSFAGWMVIGLPVSLVMMTVVYLLLVRMFKVEELTNCVSREIFLEEKAELGKMSFEEKVIAIDFSLLALLWLTRKGMMSIPGWSSLLPHGSMLDDGTVAIALALPLFLIGSREKPGRIMDWETAQKLPWGIVLLFGGGFALAKGFVDSGLSDWLGQQMVALGNLPVVLLVLSVCLVMTFLTELTSNTATTQMALPVLASVAVAVNINPLLLMLPATLSASCAFMLPVATPPNAIIFGTERITIKEMARAGLLLNLAGAIVITTMVYLLGGLAFGCEMTVIPEWIN